MAEDKEIKKEVKKKAAPKAASVEKAARAAAPGSSVKKTKAPKAAGSGKMLTVTQTGSPTGRREYQRATLIGLGLNKMNRSRTLEDTPSVRGMIATVRHLVKVEEVA